jgi:CheY-like chemotaxis protein
MENIKAMIVDPAGHSRRLLCGVFTLLDIRDIRYAASGDLALTELQLHHRDVIFCDDGTKNFPDFVRALRRDTVTRNITVPVFLISTAISHEDIRAARDCGINDVLLKPLSAGTLGRKLQAALTTPKDWVTSKDYIGPDRRVSREERRTQDCPLDFPDRRGQGERRAIVFPLAPTLIGAGK